MANRTPDTCTDDLTRYATEAELERTVKEFVERQGGRCWHVRDSRRKDVTDMLDLLIVLPPIVALIETKSQRRVVTPGQRHTLDLLADCDTILSGIMRPVPRHGELSLDDVLRLLAGDNPATGTGGTGEDGR